ncbi:MAG: GNAT family N-acetyltransferase [Candidatus Eisenbacteria bacterium]
MEPTIREITEDEITGSFFALVAEVECGDRFEFANEKHREWLLRRIGQRVSQGARFFGCYAQDGKPVGFYVLVIEDGPEGVPYLGQKAEITDIAVFPEFRSRGYGTRLLRHAERIAKKSGVYCLYVGTYAGAARAISFYVRNGLVPVATMPDVHGPHAEGNVYLRKLLR